MSNHVLLSFLLAANPDKQILVDRDDHPMPVLYQEVPWICTAVLERTAVLQSTTDPHDRFTVRHENVMVDQANVQWRDIRPSEGTFKDRMKAHQPKDAAKRQTIRAETDKRASADQATKKAPTQTNRLKQIPAEFSAWDTEASHRARKRAAPTQVVVSGMGEGPPSSDPGNFIIPLIPPAPERAKEATTMPDEAQAVTTGSRFEPSKVCPGCKKEKPKSQFPSGKGFFKCNDCRDVTTKRSVDYLAALERNKVLAADNKKHCPRCDRDLPTEAFNKNESKSDGLQAICRQCKSDTWTRGSTESRRQLAESSPEALVPVAAEAESIALSTTVYAPPTTLPGLIVDLRKLRAERDQLRQERDQACLDRDQARAELAQVYADIQEVLG